MGSAGGLASALIGLDWIGFEGQIQSKGGTAPKDAKQNPVLTKSS